MRIVKQEERTEIVDVTKDIICNVCGKSMMHLECMIEDVSEGCTISISFGYGSNKDGLIESFDLCDDCYDKFISSFKHKPTVYA